VTPWLIFFNKSGRSDSDTADKDIVFTYKDKDGKVIVDSAGEDGEKVVGE